LSLKYTLREYNLLFLQFPVCLLPSHKPKTIEIYLIYLYKTIVFVFYILLVPPFLKKHMFSMYYLLLLISLKALKMNYSKILID
jgi:hypothetical protein